VQQKSVKSACPVKSAFAFTCPMKPFFLLFHRGLTGVPKKEKSIIPNLNNDNKESLTP